MDKKPPPKVMFNFQEEEVNDAPELVILDTELNEEELIEEAEPEPILKVEEKEKIMEKEIFSDMPPEEIIISKDKGTNQRVKVKKPRKPMSERKNY